eukprot:102718_1
MFKEIVIRDVLVIEPRDFSDKHNDAILEALNFKYVNRVLQPHGLCVAVRRVVSIGTADIMPGVGAESVRVQCRLVMFQARVGQVLSGKVDYADASGLLVSLDFFKDIFIPAEELPKQSVFDKQEKVWIWKYQNSQELFLDPEEPIRFRVQRIEYGPKDQPEEFPKNALLSQLQPTMRIRATIKDGDGLGMLAWWQESEEVESDEYSE